jgi:hypothetical protein
MPMAVTASKIEVGAIRNGAMEWVEQQPPWWPFRALKVMSGNAAFWPFLALSIFGIYCQWNRASRSIRFMLCWLIVPFVIVVAISYTITPFMIERYVLSSLVGFIALVALGLVSIPNNVVRYATLAIVVAQSWAHVYHHWRTPEDIQWREAAQLAASAASGGGKIAVFPGGEPMYVLHYYLRGRDATLVNGNASFDPKSRTWSFTCGTEPVAIVQLELARDFRSSIESCYPHTLKKLRLVEVLTQ